MQYLDVLNKVIRCFSEIQIELGVLYSEPRGGGTESDTFSHARGPGSAQGKPPSPLPRVRSV